MNLERLTAELIRFCFRGRRPLEQRPTRSLASIRLALLLAAGAPSSVLAQVAFDFSYSGPGISASGILIATPEGNGEYLVTGISGERNGQAITGPIGAGGFASNDNQIYYPATTQTLYGTGGTAFLDIGGFSYMVGNLSYNVGWVNASNSYNGATNPYIPGYGEAYGGGAAAETVALANFTLSPAMGAPGPIPGSGLLSGAFLGFGVARSLWRRRGRGRKASKEPKRPAPLLGEPTPRAARDDGADRALGGPYDAAWVPFPVQRAPVGLHCDSR